MILPRNDRVLIRRIEEKQSGLILTDPDKGIKGIVLKVGEGKWIEGTWWKFKSGWEWIDGYRQLPEVRPGQKVVFNSKWNDFAADHYENLPIGADKNLHLVQEADILAVING